MRGLRAAVGFLTVVPVPDEGEDRLAGAVPWFPVIGLVVGLAVAAVYVVSSSFLPRLVAATLGIGAGIALTGALHEDGLGDVADALGRPGDPEAALRDPRLGTFGVLAVALSLLLRIGALAALGEPGAWTVIPAAHVLGRTAAAWLLLSPPHPSSSLGAAMAARTTPGAVGVATLAGVAVSVALLGWRAVPALLLAGLCALGMARWARRRLGGPNGDVLGAAEQLVEVGVFLVGAASLGR